MTTDLKTAIEAIAALEFTRQSRWRLQTDRYGASFTSEDTGAVLDLNCEPSWAEEYQERYDYYVERLALPIADIAAIAAYPWFVSLETCGEDLID
jgi:hypothetical protein